MKNIVIISGATEGLGLELAKKLLEKNYTVASISRNKQKAEQVKKEMQNYGEFLTFIGDISDEDFIIKTCDEIFEMGNILAVINNAGAVKFVAPTKNTSDIMETNMKGLYGMVYLSTQALKRFEKTGGKIVNIMSSAALKGNAMESSYCAVKWGEKGYTESLKTAYKGTNVEIYGVYQGGMNTNFFASSKDYVSDEKRMTFMNAADVASVIIQNVFSDLKLKVSDIIIERK